MQATPRPRLAQSQRRAADLIVPYSEEYQEAHREFAARMWPAKRRRRDAHYSRWKFRGPASGAVSGLLLSTDEGRVTGQLGVIPVDLRIGTGTCRAQWACDLMVDPSARRGGIGSSLLAAAMSRDVVTLGSNPSYPAEIAMTRLGFRPLAGPRIMVLPIDISHVLGWKLPQSMGWTRELLARLGQPIADVRSRLLTGRRIGVEAVSCRWEEITSLISIRQSSLTCPHVVHDSEYLKWRCSGLSGFSPEMLALRTKAGSYALAGQASPYFYVYEWSAEDEEDFLALYSVIYRIAKDVNSSTIHTLANTPHEERWLKSAGFLSLRQRVKVLWYPPERFLNNGSFTYDNYDSDGNL